ncbi:MAG TPA: VOC family protein [Marmoricola sp.]
MRLHHVQVACPEGGEDEARRFYGDGLGMTEVAKPVALAARGGVWFRAYAGVVVTAEVHVGVEVPFSPARKAHPALLLDDLDAVLDRLRALGFSVDERERDTFPGYVRAHTRDAAGNRVELLQVRFATSLASMRSRTGQRTS